MKVLNELHNRLRFAIPCNCSCDLIVFVLLENNVIFCNDFNDNSNGNCKRKCNRNILCFSVLIM